MAIFIKLGLKRIELNSAKFIQRFYGAIYKNVISYFRGYYKCMSVYMFNLVGEHVYSFMTNYLAGENNRLNKG